MEEPTIASLREEEDYPAIASRVVRDVIASVYNNDWLEFRAAYDRWAFSGGKETSLALSMGINLWFSEQREAGNDFSEAELEQIRCEIERYIRVVCEEAR